MTKHARLPIQRVPVPDMPFSAVNIDIVGPLPVCDNFRYLLTAVDRTTRWPEAFPLTDISAYTVASTFINGWVSRFGVPATITSDRGTQFTSELWSELCRRLGVQHQLTTAYRPQANGLVERFHRCLKDAMRARLVGADWLHHLPWILLGLRTAPREESSTSAAQHALGTTLLLPGQFINDDSFGVHVHRHLSGLPTLQTTHNRAVSKRKLPLLMEVDLVFVKLEQPSKPVLDPLYAGPYGVLHKSASFFTVQIGNKEEKINIHSVVPSGLPPAMPPKRGRPRKSLLI